MYRLQEFGKRKIKQYETEREFDKNLQNAAYFCPFLVAEFLLKGRELGRKMGEKTCSSSILNYSSNLEKNLFIHDSIYKNRDMDGINLTCRELPFLIEKIESLLKED